MAWALPSQELACLTPQLSRIQKLGFRPGSEFLDMGIRKKAFCVWVILLTNVIGCFIAGILIDFRIWLYLTPTIMIAGSIYMKRFLRCPRCGESIYKRRIKFWGMDFTYYGGWPVPRRCAWCGMDWYDKD